jgi:SNF2 family DNA or RNA helicase
VSVVLSLVLTLNSPQYNITSYSTGGILADMMGLGKTLTMISTIVSTIIPSREHLKLGPRTGATLVVVSSVREYFPT